VATGIPLFLQEQNAVPGRANRMLGRMARKVYAGFQGASAYFPPGRTEFSGNPVRREVVAARGTLPPGRSGPDFRVFALGGSQGARAINSLVLEMGRRVKREGGAMTFALQAGAGEFEAVEKAVREEGLPIEPFPFTERIGESFERCDAVLMRAGALSIAEASLFGKPCILIPYPYAADRHQERNAREFCAGGAGVWMPQEEATGERILETLAAWAADAGLRLAAGAAAKAFSRPDAAERIVRSALGEIGKGRGALRV
ncbi:MAG TPA: UDP-N-acetylglucosamine--N-acetylmuramyl-(pentapeptide) pyrophosphoryl-undecaprenol N-acetylglucosamine transferase, partial [Candidatus Deferrimicrobiaceae bacterium]